MSRNWSSRATLRDVAALAGVNQTTVSVVLNGTRSGTRVSEATRTRILAAAAELKYRPNAAARGVSRRRMDAIGVVAQIGVETEPNFYFIEILYGVLQEARARHQITTLYPITDWHTEEESMLDLFDGRVDGLVFIGPHFQNTFIPRLQERGAFVTIHASPETSGDFNIEVDDAGGAFAAVTHLISLGHRRILHLVGDLTTAGGKARCAGYQRALEEADIPIDASLLIPCGFWGGAAAEILSEILQTRRLSEFPTAIFCGNDSVALASIETLNRHGLRVPEDVSVVGFDDILKARLIAPSLTTVRQPLYELGQWAVRTLLAQIHPSEPEAGREPMPVAAATNETFPVELIVRGTTGPPRLRVL